jgi:DNA-binding NarL/FixJ family response regulator
MKRTVPACVKPAMGRTTRLLIADNQLLMALCLQQLLDRDFPGVKIVENLQELVEVVARSTPDLILLDLVMPLPKGIELMRRIRTVSPITKVVVVTEHSQPDCVGEALRAGAVGYLLKSCSVSELTTAIWQVLQGRSYVTPMIGQRVIPFATNSQPQSGVLTLTSRQQQVLQLIARGHTAKEIAAALNLSVKTAVFHKTGIMDKLGLRTTAELTRYALERGIVPVTSKPAPQPFFEASGAEGPATAATA